MAKSPARRDDMLFAAAFMVIGFIISARFFHDLWSYDALGYSRISHKTPYHDFANLWAGTRMAISGHVADLFDLAAYRANLQQMFLMPLSQEWSYPPSMLLFGAPFALLPVFPAWLAWTFGTIFALWLAIRPMKLGAGVEAAILVSPAVATAALFGQNGSLVAALLIGGLMAAPTRPVLGGFLIGLLTIKPHFGVLIPVALLATGNWRAIVSAGVTTVALVAGSAAWFGVDTWVSFWTFTRPLMTEILEATFPQPYQANAQTMFFLTRTLGADVTTAYAVQGVLTLIAIATTFWLWLPKRNAELREKVALTAVMALLASPYGYSYDTVPLAVAIGLLFAQQARAPRFVVGLMWIYPLFVQVVNASSVGFGVFVPLTLAVWMVETIQQRERNEMAEPAAATAS